MRYCEQTLTIQSLSLLESLNPGEYASANPHTKHLLCEYPCLCPLPVQDGEPRFDLHNSKMSVYRKVFELFDEDGSGSISCAELDVCTRALGEVESPRTRHSLASSADEPLGGQLGSTQQKQPALHCTHPCSRAHGLALDGGHHRHHRPSQVAQRRWPSQGVWRLCCTRSTPIKTDTSPSRPQA